MRILTLALFTTLLFSCNSRQKPPESGAMVELISGKSVRVYSIERISYVNDQLPSSLLLKYETALEPVDSKALRDEVREVWLVLQPKADSSGDVYAMVKAIGPTRGPPDRAPSFTYGFNRVKKGVWKMREPSKL